MKFGSYMLISISIIGFLITALILRRINLSMQFDKEVKLLFTQSGTISQKKFSYSELSGLPEPVQRYFKLVLKDSQPFISYIRLTHDGQFKTSQDKQWVNIKGEQYFTTEKP